MAIKELNTTNPECILWQYDQQLHVAIMGGVRIAGLDSLRVTLKVTWKQLSVRYSLDMYNDGALDKLVRRCAERLGLGIDYITHMLTCLIDTLEEYRLAELDKIKTDMEVKKVLSSEEQQQAVDFLKRPDLLQRTNELIGQSGVIGEDNNRLLMFLVFTSRKREQPLHIISLGSSGSALAQVTSPPTSVRMGLNNQLTGARIYHPNLFCVTAFLCLFLPDSISYRNIAVA